VILPVRYRKFLVKAGELNAILKCRSVGQRVDSVRDGFGINMARLIIHGFEGLAQVIDLYPGINRLGRHDENDFKINHPSISAFHCEIERSEDLIQVRDLNSTNGTFISGEQITEGILQPGEILKLGEVEIVRESANIRVAIPQMTAPPPKRKTGHFPPGTIPCSKHEEKIAGYQCNHCHKPFCPSCVRRVKLVGSPESLFCPDCKKTCSPLPVSRTAGSGSIMSRIKKTIRLFTTKQ